MLQTERAFTLPHGYVDDHGSLHREGVMRMATAEDEIAPLRETAVQQNPAYLTVLVLSRVVTRLGTLELISPRTVERLFAADVAYLQDLYNDMNQLDVEQSAVTCPACNHDFEVSRARVGES